MLGTDMRERVHCRALTRGPQHHFFGYYDKSPWDASGRWLLAMEAEFMDRPPVAGDPLVIGLIDTADGDCWYPIATTYAWNWQQGCMLQWLRGGVDGEIIFNDLRQGQFIARVLNIHTRAERVIERPVYTVDPTGHYAISLSFARLHRLRRGYGYEGVADAYADCVAPQEDGLYRIDLQTGQSCLILSLAEVVEFQTEAGFERRIHRFNHAQFNRTGTRFGVLHRHQAAPSEPHLTRLLTMNVDGSGLWLASGDEMVSHYDWGRDDVLLAWARRKEIGDRYFLFHDQRPEFEVIGEEDFSDDGHCSFSPDGQWMLTDSYPDSENCRDVMLYNLARRERVDLGRFYSMPMADEIRCDLHPRWSRCGGKVCIDSTHEGTRQMYQLDLNEIL